MEFPLIQDTKKKKKTKKTKKKKKKNTPTPPPKHLFLNNRTLGSRPGDKGE